MKMANSRKNDELEYHKVLHAVLKDYRIKQ